MVILHNALQFCAIARVHAEERVTHCPCLTGLQLLHSLVQKEKGQVGFFLPHGLQDLPGMASESILLVQEGDTETSLTLRR